MVDTATLVGAALVTAAVLAPKLAPRGLVAPVLFVGLHAGLLGLLLVFG